MHRLSQRRFSLNWDYLLHRLTGEWLFLLAKYRLKWLRLWNPKRKILAFVMLDHLGDVVASEPMVRHLREQCPDSLIIWYVKAQYRQVLKYHPALNQVSVLKCVRHWNRIQNLGLIDRVITGHFDVYTCHGCGSRLQKLNGDRQIDYSNYLHHRNLLSVYCQSAGVPDLGDMSPKLYLGPGPRFFGLTKPYVVLHTQSNMVIKEWELTKWCDLISAIRQHFDIDIVEIGLKPSLSHHIKDTFFHDFCGRLGLLHMADVLRNARLFVGIDSGPAHCANALGIPGVILLGQFASFESYMPFSGYYAQGDQCQIVRNGGGKVRDITVEKVFVATETLLKDLIKTQFLPGD